MPIVAPGRRNPLSRSRQASVYRKCEVPDEWGGEKGGADFDPALAESCPSPRDAYRIPNETSPGLPSLGTLQRGFVGLQISIRKSDDVTILDLRGRATIDADESDLLESYLQKLVAQGARKLLLNLAELTQVDSSGLSVIVGMCVSLRRRGGALRVMRPSGHVLEVFRVLRLIDAIPSFEDEAQALASFRSQGYAASPS